MYSKYSVLNSQVFIYLTPLLDRIANIERHYILIPLNFFVYNHVWAGRLVVFFGNYLTYLILAGILIWAVVQRDRIKTIKALLVAFLSFVLARLILVEIIRAILPRSRPFVNWVVHQLILNESGAGFPSGHTSALFAIAMAIYFYDKKFGMQLFILSILVGIGRVASGVHYPTDILAGITVGIIAAWLVEKFIAPKLNEVSLQLSSLTNRLLPFTKR